MAYGTVSAKSRGKVVGGSPFPFTFEYTVPTPIARPAEAPVGAARDVQITLLGLGDVSSKSPSDFTVLCCSDSARVRSILAREFTMTMSRVVLQVAMPLCAAARDHVCSVGLNAEASYEFTFTYFQPPQVVSVFPSSAYLDGRVNRNSEPGTIRVELSGVDRSVTSNQLSVTIAGNTCDILNVTSSTLDTRTLFCLVPAYTSAQTVDLVVDTNGRLSNPYPFQYTVLEPMVLSALACKVCNVGKRCLVNGRCGGNVPPFLNRAPFTTASRVTLFLDSMNAGTAASNIRANLGTDQANITASNIVSASNLMSVIEFQLPDESSNKGLGQFQVYFTGSQKAPFSLAFSLFFFDDRIELTCSGGCAARSANAQPVAVTVTGLNITSTDQIEFVKFGTLPASSFAVDSSASGEFVTYMTVTPPTVAACAYSSR
jgi:hypothetical protein